MRKITLALLAIGMAFIGTKASAQGKYGADSAECIKYLSYYVEYYKTKNYEEALPNWRKAYSVCPPSARENMLIQGSTLMQKEIAKAKDPALRQARIDTLLTLQDQRAATYPKSKVKALNNKGLYIAQYIKDDNKFIYDELNKIISENQEQTLPNIFLLDLNSAISLFKDDELTAEDVINTYQNAIAMFEKMEQNDDNARAKSDLEGLFIGSKVASCENLISLFTPRLEAAPEDMDLITNIVRISVSELKIPLFPIFSFRLSPLCTTTSLHPIPHTISTNSTLQRIMPNLQSSILRRQSLQRTSKRPVLRITSLNLQHTV